MKKLLSIVVALSLSSVAFAGIIVPVRTVTDASTWTRHVALPLPAPAASFSGTVGATASLDASLAPQLGLHMQTAGPTAVGTLGGNWAVTGSNPPWAAAPHPESIGLTHVGFNLTTSTTGGNTVPDYVAAILRSSDGAIWASPGQTALAGTQSYLFGLGGWFQWNAGDVPSATWANSIANVVNVGALVAANIDEAHQWTVNSYTLYEAIPEPGTIMALASAIFGLGFGYRKNLRAKLASLRSSIV